MKKIIGLLLLFVCTNQIHAQIDTTISQPQTDTTIFKLKTDAAIFKLKTDTAIFKLKTDTAIFKLKTDTLIQNNNALQLDSLVLDSVGLYKLKAKAKVMTGIASFYSKNLDGTKTATGEYYRNSKLTAASNNYKLNTWVKVTNLSNDNFVIVRINDRMHPRMAKRGRVVDLSRAAAKELDFMKKGLTRVRVEPIDR